MRLQTAILLGCLPFCVSATALGAKNKEEAKRTPWSFGPLQRTEPPEVKNTDWPRNRIDLYILAQMEEAGLRPSSPAAVHTLLRRLSFDLTGLPPSEADLRQWTAVPGKEVSAAIAGLLASPHYGERWGRHWLDLARYTDKVQSWLFTAKSSYLYRDWVVQAFNQDMPYDRFILRQLATDYLLEYGPEELPALGFLGLSPAYFKELQLPPDIIKTTVADEWEEHVDAVGRTFLGLTVACARCHDHKSDPITAQDYYALAGVFASVKRAERPTLDAELWAPVAVARGQVEALETEIADLKKKKPKDLAAQVATRQKQIESIIARTPHYNVPMASAVEDAALYVVEADNKKGTKLDYKLGMARDLEMHKRGNPNDVGEMVPRRFLSAFPSKSGKPRRFTQGSGRLDLAEALIDEAAPLTARVMVNRIWKHHFGRGLVDTPSEFGNLGEAPSHPALLDDLAARFIEHGWSIKWLHREILSSATWQQTSYSPENEQQDPENRFFARMPRRRLDWESWRDAILTASGQLDVTLGGQALAINDPANQRRSLYGASDRHDMDPMLRIHDVPDGSAHNPWRVETITPLQGLFALNSPFMQQQADLLGGLMQKQSTGSLEEKIRKAYLQVFQRRPDSRETALALDFFQDREFDTEAWSQYAQALLVSNEMQFVD